MPNKKIFIKDKKATIGETITWMFATIIIIIFLFISIFAALPYLKENKRTSFSERNSDLLASESFFAWLLTEDSTGQMIHEQLKIQYVDLNDFNGNLAVKIFKEFYGKDYSTVWAGVNFLHVGGTPLNKYFHSEPRTETPGIRQEIPLNEDKSVKLVLIYKRK